MKHLRTDEAARACGVSSRLLTRWLDQGQLKCNGVSRSTNNWKTIPGESLVEFMREHGIPLGDLEYQTKNRTRGKVLVVSQDQGLIEYLERELSDKKSFSIIVAANSFRGGIIAGRFRPDLILIDFEIGELEAIQICQDLRDDVILMGTILFALLNDDDRSSLDPLTINETFEKSFDATLLAERLHTLVRERREPS